MGSKVSSRKVRNSGDEKKLTLFEFIETYNMSNSTRKDYNTPYPNEVLDRLYNKVCVNIKKQCGINNPDFEINIFGKITKVHGGIVV